MSDQLSESALARQGIRAPSVATSVTHVQEKDYQIPDISAMPIGGADESATPSNKEREALDILDDDWELDPANPRNWSNRKKWVGGLFALNCFLSLISTMADCDSNCRQFHTELPPLCPIMVCLGVTVYLCSAVS